MRKVSLKLVVALGLLASVCSFPSLGHAKPLQVTQYCSDATFVNSIGTSISALNQYALPLAVMTSNQANLNFETGIAAPMPDNAQVNRIEVGLINDLDLSPSLQTIQLLIYNGAQAAQFNVPTYVINTFASVEYLVQPGLYLGSYSLIKGVLTLQRPIALPRGPWFFGIRFLNGTPGLTGVNHVVESDIAGTTGFYADRNSGEFTLLPGLGFFRGAFKVLGQICKPAYTYDAAADIAALDVSTEDKAP